MATRLSGKAKSGAPGRPAGCPLNFTPSSRSRRRTARSALVSVDLTRAITALRSARVKVSGIGDRL
jgi:hypothetical protein